MSRRLSAFAAKKLPMDIGEGEEDEEIIIRYNASSSDDDDFPVLDPPPAIPSAGTPILQTTTTTTTTSFLNNNNKSAIRPITCSNFKPDDDNLVFSDEFVTVGLKQSEFLIVKGQYKLVVQRGCLKIDTVLYHASEVPIVIISPTMVSVPILYADQVIDRSLVSDMRTEINDHLFSSDYKTVLKLENHFTGLEDIGQLYPPLKNIFPNDSLDEEVIQTEWDLKFKYYSFQPILQDDGVNSSVIGTMMSKNWIKQIENLTNEVLQLNNDLTNNNSGLMKILVIGSKNSGKSTFLRKLLNHILYKTDYCIPVNLMDLDPGQPEYSAPDCVSISSINKDILGFNISPLSQLPKNDNDDDDITMLSQKYIGYSNPNRNPQRYEKLCHELCDYYETHLQKLNQVLLVNTPGWIKGYGIELLKKLTLQLKPTHLLFLTPQGVNIDHDSELLRNLKYDNLIPIHGFVINNTISLKYSPAQLRMFKILSYFHNTKNRLITSTKSFDFKPLILSHSPYTVSYNDSDDVKSFKGISLVHILQAPKILRQQYLKECLEAVVVGIYTIDIESYQNMILFNKMVITEGLPNLILEDISNVGQFHGLALIHSVNTDKKVINMYTPIDPLRLNRDDDDDGGMMTILVRGRTEIPIEEIAPRDFYKNDKSILKKMPYVTFDKQVGKGGKVLKVRRNIMRRSHQ